MSFCGACLSHLELLSCCCLSFLRISSTFTSWPHLLLLPRSASELSRIHWLYTQVSVLPGRRFTTRAAQCITASVAALLVRGDKAGAARAVQAESGIAIPAAAENAQHLRVATFNCTGWRASKEVELYELASTSGVDIIAVHPLSSE